MKGIKGYKMFLEGWVCDPTGINPFHFKVGEVFEENVVPKVGKRGFHFSEDIEYCLGSYPFTPSSKVAEVLALGDVDSDGIMSCTNKIRIVREIPFEEVLKLANTGKYNFGYGNSGDKNSGYWNTGSCNTGKRNAGSRNTGNFNIGDSNTGDNNTGSNNTGDSNSGHGNSGFRNSGDFNSGDGNSGSYNSGDWNKCDHSSGCFNTVPTKIRMFNKPSPWTYKDWDTSRAHAVLTKMPIAMGDRQEWWDNLRKENKDAVRQMPNFDRDIFKEITGIDFINDRLLRRDRFDVTRYD